jgi:hypothetical protein
LWSCLGLTTQRDAESKGRLVNQFVGGCKDTRPGSLNKRAVTAPKMKPPTCANWATLLVLALPFRRELELHLRALQDQRKMTSSWQIKNGHLVRSWSGQVADRKYELPVMQSSSDIQGSYLPPMPDFASHSPFGGPPWFCFLPEVYSANLE